MEVDASIYRSPKRKRGQVAHHPSLITSGLSQVISASIDPLEDIGSYSPSTRVTGKFQKLDLQSPIDLGPSIVSYSPNDDEGTPVELAVSNSAGTTPSQDFKPPESATFEFESPVNSGVASLSNPPVPAFGRMKSPPPSSVVSDQFWHASEITGWSPDDPDEDNYGINGVGYAKPAGKAWAISQKRKQQIADYRSRETREARQARHERRLSGFNSRRGSPKAVSRHASQGSEGAEESKNGPGERRAVRFVEFEAG